MRKLKKIIQIHLNLANIMSNFALCFAGVAANTKCYFIYHQPKAPEGLKNLRKF